MKGLKLQARSLLYGIGKTSQQRCTCTTSSSHSANLVWWLFEATSSTVYPSRLFHPSYVAFRSSKPLGTTDSIIQFGVHCQSSIPRPWIYTWNKGTPLKFVLNFCLRELCKYCEALRLQPSGIFRLSWIRTFCSLLSVGSNIINIEKLEQCSVLGWIDLFKKSSLDAAAAFKARQIKKIRYQFEINNYQCSIKFW